MPGLCSGSYDDADQPIPGRLCGEVASREIKQTSEITPIPNERNRHKVSIYKELNVAMERNNEVGFEGKIGLSEGDQRR
jgi:hypothetical protein